MSDCPDCDNEGFVWADGGDDEPLMQVRCTNWRHRCLPTLDQIASAIRDGRELPRMNNPFTGGK